VLAVVPSFRAPTDDLLPLVATLLSQTTGVVVADDASPCTSDVALRDVAALGAEVVRHDRNAGIARSLNAGLTRAVEVGARWLLTVDQDSVLADDYVARLLEAAEAAESELGQDRVGAVGAGSIDDASGELSYPVYFEGNVPTTHEVIQTGTIWHVASLGAAGGFDERLGIDAVDAAACLRLRERGQLVVLATDLCVAHRVGEGRQVSVLGRSVLASGHSPHRRTTMVRNRLRLFPAEFAQSPVHALRTLRRVAVNTALAVTIEDDRWAKAKSSARGVFPARQR
jgi:rhamnosyltransferase